MNGEKKAPGKRAGGSVPILGHARRNKLTAGDYRCGPGPHPSRPIHWYYPVVLAGREWGPAPNHGARIHSYIPRAITIFMISFDPPKMRLTRLSRNMRAIG